MCENNFHDCLSQKIEHFGKYDTFLQCEKCHSGQVKQIDLCCVKPDRIFVNLLRSDGKPTKRQYCKNCGDTSAVIKMNPSNEYINLPVLNKSDQVALQNNRQKRRTDFYSYMQDLKKAAFEKEQQEFTESYHAYLKTKEWFTKRTKVLKRDNFICQGCLDNKATQVHHLTYLRIFKEPLFDLVSVCDKCHNNIHNTDN